MSYVIGRYGHYSVEEATIGQGRSGTVHPIAGEPCLVYKRYRRPLDEATSARVQYVVEHGRAIFECGEAVTSTPRTSLCWPIDYIPAAARMSITGVVMPTIPAPFTGPSGPRSLDFLILRRAHPPTALGRASVLIRLAEVLNWIDQAGYVHGDISFKNVVWTLWPDPGAFVLDVDILNRQRPPPQTGSATPGWMDPRLVERLIPAPDHYSDRYALALAVYRGLLVIAGNLNQRADGSWPRPQHIPPALAPAVSDLLHAALDHPLDPDSRPSAEAWVSTLATSFIPGGKINEATLDVLDGHGRHRHPAELQPVPGDTCSCGDNAEGNDENVLLTSLHPFGLLTAATVILALVGLLIYLVIV